MDFSNKLSDLKQQHLYRSRNVVVVQDTQIVIDGKSLINFVLMIIYPLLIIRK